MRQTLMLAALLALTGCATDDVGVGDAVHHNTSVAVVDPNPRLAGLAPTTGDPQRGIAAQRRYARGKVYDLVRPTIETFFPGKGDNAK